MIEDWKDSNGDSYYHGGILYKNITYTVLVDFKHIYVRSIYIFGMTETEMSINVLSLNTKYKI